MGIENLNLQVRFMVELREITENNYEECFHLHATVDDENFVDSVTYSLAEAWIFYRDTEAFAIYSDETMVGFVSMYVGEENYQIINLLIADEYQRKGYGTQAAKACIDFLQRKYSAKRISVPVEVRHTAAQAFWRKIGFSFSDTVEDGYVFMRLYLS